MKAITLYDLIYGEAAFIAKESGDGQLNLCGLGEDAMKKSTMLSAIFHTPNNRVGRLSPAIPWKVQ